MLKKAKKNLLQMSLVAQEPILYAKTVAENIAYAWPHKEPATKEQIIAAAKMANAHDFIVKLPKQYDTQVGEKGVTLSGERLTAIS